jgi:FKBP-type peptidyl-prolyl cis-trans isomerase FkpA
MQMLTRFALMAVLMSSTAPTVAQDAPPPAAPATAPAPAITLETVTPGSGATPTDADVVLVNYRGTLTDGTMFDEGQRVVLPVGRLIPGFTQGLKQMRVGGSYRLTIPAVLGYGDRQSGPIPPNSDLIFTIDLLDAGPPERARAMMGLAPVRVDSIVSGTGRMPTEEELVLITYTGRLTDGTVFDSGQNAVLFVNQLVPGFAQGLMQMRSGGRYRLFIPADLAYGSSGAGPIPPNSDLLFEVELIATNRLAEVGAMMRVAAASSPRP